MIRVFYDGECPFCSRYVQMMRLQRSDDVQLIDLRQNDAWREDLLAAGFNLDGGMVVEDRGLRIWRAVCSGHSGSLAAGAAVLLGDLALWRGG